MLLWIENTAGQLTEGRSSEAGQHLVEGIRGDVDAAGADAEYSRTHAGSAAGMGGRAEVADRVLRCPCLSGVPQSADAQHRVASSYRSQGLGGVQRAEGGGEGAEQEP
ncbi:hypothetical protein GCM10010377_51940 [Streptomyces viridiviolaceus]|nr:hypothetical protein GCM10010377_51940 [Streptomyces viridiviolaceus]